MRDHASVVIVGAGIVGCSVAYHLSKLGLTDVVVVEQGPLFETGGSTSHAPGLIFQVNPSRTMTEFAKYSVDLYSRLEGDGGPCFYPVGGLEAAWTEERFADFKRRRGLALSYGVDAELIGPREMLELVPIVAERVVGGLYVPSDGIGKAVRAAEAMARGAQTAGVVFRADTRVTDIEVTGGRVRAVVTDRGRIRADLVVCAAGIWGPKVGRMAGVSIPLYPMQHQYARSGPLAALKGQTGEASHPIMRHQDGGLYFRQHGEGYGMGSSDHEPLPVEPEDIVDHGEPGVMPAAMAFTAADFEPARRSAEEFIPALKGAELVEGFNGMFSFTPDAMPVLGESDEVRGFWAAEAVWIAHAGGAGKAVAEWIVKGSPSLDLRECDITRFHPHARKRPYWLARGVEQYREGPTVHHPLDQMYSARDTRPSPFHSKERELGAVFFESAGWEIPQWYEANGPLLDGYDEPWKDRKGWPARNWSPIAGAEHRSARERAALFDLTAITKLEVTGPGALAGLQRVMANQMDQPTGRITYTSVLNDGGGIVSDLTVTRLADDRFMVMTSTGYGYRDLKWLRDHMGADVAAQTGRDVNSFALKQDGSPHLNLPPRGEEADHMGADGSVSIEDVSDDLGCLCLWGPRARDIITAASGDDFSNEAFPYRGARHVTIGGVPALAIRLSYVGELGWELYVPWDRGADLWEALWEAGRPHGLIAAGTAAFTSMRIEKGSRLGGTDIHTEYNPYEAGLGFAVRLSKGEFIGRDALMEAREAGLRRKLCCMTLDDPEAVVMGSEPVMSGERALGFVTSADYGYSVGRGIAYAYLPVEYAEPGTSVDILYFNERYAARVVEEPLYDPGGKRMRA